MERERDRGIKPNTYIHRCYKHITCVCDLDNGVRRDCVRDDDYNRTSL